MVAHERLLRPTAQTRRRVNFGQPDTAQTPAAGRAGPAPPLRRSLATALDELASTLPALRAVSQALVAHDTGDRDATRDATSDPMQEEAPNEGGARYAAAQCSRLPAKGWWLG